MDIHTTLLETYFFRHIDRGIAPNQTPLFQGIADGHSLREELSNRFAIPAEDAEKAIELARKEVEL